MIKYVCNGLLVKWLNTPPSQGGIHGFETRTDYQLNNMQLNSCFLLIFSFFYCFYDNIMIIFIHKFVQGGFTMINIRPVSDLRNSFSKIEDIPPKRRPSQIA